MIEIQMYLSLIILQIIFLPQNITNNISKIKITSKRYFPYLFICIPVHNHLGFLNLTLEFVVFKITTIHKYTRNVKLH